MFNISYSSYTDCGDVKIVNQDSVFGAVMDDAGCHAGLFVVADGMGGLNCGEEISSLITLSFEKLWREELGRMLAGGSLCDDELNRLLNSAIIKINREAVSYGNKLSKKAGSTLSLLLTTGRKYYIKNIGDSRVYLMRGKKLKQLTADQSLLADMIRNKEIKSDEIRSFKKKNVLTMCVGIFDDVKIFSTTGRIKNGDRFLLCSDGLYNYVEGNALDHLAANKKARNPESGISTLLDGIPAGRAKDNVSAILVNYRFGLWDFK